MTDRLQLIIDGDDYWLEGGDFEDMLDAVRAVRGRRYDSQAKAWELPGTPEHLAAALKPLRIMYMDDDVGSSGEPAQVLPD